jgi:hypothetical protein
MSTREYRPIAGKQRLHMAEKKSWDRKFDVAFGNFLL